MNAGKLNQRVLIERPVDAVDIVGQTNRTWAPVAEVWADIRILSGVESIKSDALTSVARASVRIRWVAGVDASHRVTHRNTTYSIEAVLVDPQHRYIDLACEATNAQS